MRLNVKIFGWSLVFTVISVVLCICCEYCNCDLSNYRWLSFLIGHRQFYSSIFMSIFTGTLISIITSLISYQNKKRKLLERFYVAAERYSYKLNDLRYDEKDFYEKMKYDSTVTEMDDMYFDMRFFFKNKSKHKRIYESIFSPIIDVHKCFKNEDYDKLKTLVFEKDENDKTVFVYPNKATRRLQKAKKEYYFKYMYGYCLYKKEMKKSHNRQKD